MPRTGQCRHGWTQERKKRATTAGKSGPTAGTKSIANCRQTEGSWPSVKQTTNNHHSCRSPDTDHPTRQQRRQPKQHRGADGSDNCSKIGSSAVAVHRGNHRDPCLSARFRRSWKFLHYSAMMRKSSSGPQCLKDYGDVAGYIHWETFQQSKFSSEQSGYFRFISGNTTEW